MRASAGWKAASWESNFVMDSPRQIAVAPHTAPSNRRTAVAVPLGRPVGEPEDMRMPRQKTVAFGWAVFSTQSGCIDTLSCHRGQSFGVSGKASMCGPPGWTWEASHLRAVFAAFRFGAGAGRSFSDGSVHGPWRRLSGWLAFGSL